MVSALRRLRGWWARIPIDDPVEKRSALIAGGLSLAGVAWVVLALTIALARDGLQVAAGWLVLGALALPCFLLAIWCLRRGRLTTATWLLVIGSGLGPAALFVLGGLVYATHALRLVAIPLVLAAFFLGRRGVWTVFAANAALLTIGALRDRGAPGAVLPPALGLFGGTLVFSFVLAALLDQLGGWLRDSLAETRERAAHLQVAFATFPDLILMARPDGVVTSVNEGFTRLTGWEPAEVVGKTTADLGLWAEPGQRAQFFAEVLGGKVVENLEVTVRRRDGGRRICLLSARVITVGGERHLLGMARDITDRRRAEEERAAAVAHLEALFESTADMIWSVDAEEFRLLSFNRGLSEYFRRSRHIIITIGSGPDDHFPDAPAAAEYWRSRYRRALSEGPFSEEYVVFAGNRTLQAYFTPLVRDGRAFGVSVFGRDVTEQKQLERTVQQAQKMEALGRLSGGIAHDFNNLLAVVRVSAALLEQEVPPDAPLRPDVDAIVTAAERGAVLTRQLLDFSRQEVLPRGRSDATRMLRELSAVLPRVLGSRIQVSTVAPGDLGAVPLTEVQLQQVLLNLAINARDAMPMGGALAIEARRRCLAAGEVAELGPGEYVVLALRDTGIGMTEEVKARLFEPFFTTKPAGSGTGLGLSTSLGIVRGAGGTMSVESAPGEGTTFSIWLPVVPFPPPAAVGPGPGARRPATVLVVDDEPELLDALARIVASDGHRVVEASGAAEALRKADQHDIDVLVSDLVLREGDGITVLEGMRSRRPQVGVVLTSGFSDRIRPPSGAGIEFVPKPFTPEQLLGALGRVLGGSERPT